MRGSRTGRGISSLSGTGVALRLASLTVVLVAPRIKQLRGGFARGILASGETEAQSRPVSWQW